MKYGELFDGSNYMDWSFNAKINLKGKNLWAVVEQGIEVEENPVGNPENITSSGNPAEDEMKDSSATRAALKSFAKLGAPDSIAGTARSVVHDERAMSFITNSVDRKSVV